MSGGPTCSCPEAAKPVSERAWFVYQYKCNHSAFNGYHRTPSDYSSVGCRKCNTVWRTKAAYADELPEAEL